MPLLVGAVRVRPRWALLAWASLSDRTWQADLVNEAIVTFIDEVRDLFDRSSTPPPPVEEQPAEADCERRPRT